MSVRCTVCIVREEVKAFLYSILNDMTAKKTSIDIETDSQWNNKSLRELNSTGCWINIIQAKNSRWNSMRSEKNVLEHCYSKWNMKRKIGLCLNSYHCHQKFTNFAFSTGLLRAKTSVFLPFCDVRFTFSHLTPCVLLCTLVWLNISS